jgi:hypothetical protein
LKLGICGEHGGDPASIRFCAETGLDYVSCSPYRVPIARLAAAQAELAARPPVAPAPSPKPASKRANPGTARTQRVLLAAGRRPAAVRVSTGKAAPRAASPAKPAPKTAARAVSPKAGMRPPAKPQGPAKPGAGGKTSGKSGSRPGGKPSPRKKR